MWAWIGRPRVKATTAHIFKLVKCNERVARCKQQRLRWSMAILEESGTHLPQPVDHQVGLGRIYRLIIVAGVVVAAVGAPMRAHDLLDGDQLTDGCGRVTADERHGS